MDGGIEPLVAADQQITEWRRRDLTAKDVALALGCAARWEAVRYRLAWLWIELHEGDDLPGDLEHISAPLVRILARVIPPDD